MSILQVAGAALVACLASSQAFGLTITNRDASPQAVTVQKGVADSVSVLPPGGTVEEICENGCIVGMSKGGEGDVSPTEDQDNDHSAGNEDRLVINGGILQQERP